MAKSINFTMFVEPCSRPVDEHWNPVATLVFGSLLTSHTCIEKVATRCRSIIGRENENSIFFRGTGTSPYIYVGDHSKEGGDPGLLILIKV